MKKAIVLTFLIILLPACGLIKQGEGVVFNDTPATTQIKTVELFPYYTTNLVNGVDVITTNFVTRSVVKDVEYSKTEINPQVEMVAKNVGGYFGPIGEGVAGLLLVAAGVYKNVRTSIKRKKAEREATQANDKYTKLEKVARSLVNSIEIAKSAVDEKQKDQFLKAITDLQDREGTRSAIRTDLLNKK